jgi:hypothetical protein
MSKLTTFEETSNELDEYLNKLLTDSKNNQHYEEPNDDIDIINNDDSMQEDYY